MRRQIDRDGGQCCSRPVAADAQQAAKLATIGYLGATTLSAESQRFPAFVQRLRELGWIDNRTIAIEVRWAEGRNERFAEIAAEFVRLKVDVIVTAGTAAIVASKQVTSVIPIVFAVAGDRSGPVWSRAWRDRAAMLPACRSRQLIWLASGLKFCARVSPISAGWRSWAMSALRFPCWRCTRCRKPPVRLGLRSPRQKFGGGGYRASLRRAQEPRGRTLCLCGPARNHQPEPHRHPGAGRATADDAWPTGKRGSGRC